jgi:hypothetical protein
MDKILLEASLIENYGWKPHDEYDKEGDCHICFTELINSIVLELPCGHLYHQNCILTNIYDYNRLTCPECPQNKQFEPLVVSKKETPILSNTNGTDITTNTPYINTSCDPYDPYDLYDSYEPELSHGLQHTSYQDDSEYPDQFYDF